MRIALLALPGSMRSALAGLTDLFWLANQVIQQNSLAADVSELFHTRIITSSGASVPDAQGRAIESDGAFGDAEPFDLIIASGMKLDENKYPVASGAVSEAAEWVKSCHAKGCVVAGACAGGFILGEAGLLNGRICTTTWWLFHTFRERYPRAKPVWGKALAAEDNVITSGGPLSWVDLALHIVGLYAGKEIARLTADMAVADSQPLSQHLYAPKGFLNSRHPLLIKAEHLVRYENPAITVEQLAAALNMTSRTLHRKMQDLVQESPKSFITRVRIETAVSLLETPGKTIGQIATACGYSDETVFRRAFSAVTGMSPAQYKAWLLSRNFATGHQGPGVF